MFGEQKDRKFSREEEMIEKRPGVESLKIYSPPSTRFALVEGEVEGDGFSPRSDR